MDTLIHICPFGLADASALVFTLFMWLVIGWFVEHPPKSRPSVSQLMQAYRREWMVQFVTREPRIFDGAMIDNLRTGTAFFASTSLIAIGGGVALIGNPALVLGIARDLTLTADATGFQVRVLLVIGFLANALLKFIWSNRLFGYCAIMMAAAPNDPADPLASHRAAQAAEINITAARSFNRGLHSIYFALGSLAWLLGPLPLFGATVLTGLLLVRREFASESREIILRGA